MILIQHGTLYKLDSTGKVREWTIRVIEEDGIYYYEQIHGVCGGKLQSTRTSIETGKNIGKANETSPLEQCKAEALSLWTKQKERKGYSLDVPDEKPQLPMLAKSYKDDGHKISWPAMVQPKLDGIRCSMHIGKHGNIVLKSRANKEFKSLQHLSDAVRDLLPDIQGLVGMTLDGELYHHELKDDFQTLISLIKRDKPSYKTDMVQYHIYDMYDEDDFVNRNTIIKESNLFKSPCFQYVPTYEVSSFDDFLNKYSEFVNDGYEGAMLRNIIGPYECNRRSPNLQKYKEFLDQEFIIVGAYQNVGKQTGQCTFECMTTDGYRFGVKPRGTDEQRKQMWQDWLSGKLNGKYMTVRFFSWTTSEQPVPRFPVGIAIRDYE